MKVMKRIHTISALIGLQIMGLSLSAGLYSDTTQTFTSISQGEMAFEVGEQLDYNIRYGLVKAGEATLEIKQHLLRRNKQVYHMIGTGRTTGMTDWFFRTRDRYETYIDTATMLPVEFIRDIDEGGYLIDRHIFFDDDNQRARDTYVKDSVFTFEQSMQDIFSAFYFARNMDINGIRVGDEVKIDVFLDHEHFPFRLKYMGVESVELDDFEIDCMKFMPIVQEGRVFKGKETMTIWVSDDKNRIPVRLQSELAVGSVKVDLSGYAGLAHPLNLK